MSAIARSVTAIALTAMSALALAAQPTSAPPNSAALFVNASNSASYQVTLETVSIPSITSPRDPASGQATGKRVHKPIRAHAPAGIYEQEGHFTGWPAAVAPTEDLSLSAMVELTSHTGSACKAGMPATFKPSTKRIELSLGDVARFFDAEGKPRGALCGR
jgi:hypothetical protein